jgi:GABA(A) receptor-associated protein
MQSFKQEYSFQHRLAEASKIKAKYPDRIPVIVEPGKAGLFSKKTPDLDKKKYLVPDNLTVGQFQFIIRKRLQIPEHDAMFLLVNNTLMPTSELMSVVYDKQKDDDLFLYVNYSMESVYGF